MIDLATAIQRPVSRETYERLNHYAALLVEENRRQNLISGSTLDSLWERHILDSAQLVRFQPRANASWVDIGSGAGLPGIVIAALIDGPVALVEPRRLRAEFLRNAIEKLGLAATVHLAKAEALKGQFDMITARAVASLDRFLGLSAHLALSETIWVLPKGRRAKSELAEARRNWQCEARIEPSITDPESAILVLSNVKAKSKR